MALTKSKTLPTEINPSSALIPIIEYAENKMM
jgi:hypothetical protein